MIVSDVSPTHYQPFPLLGASTAMNEIASLNVELKRLSYRPQKIQMLSVVKNCNYTEKSV